MVICDQYANGISRLSHYKNLINFNAEDGLFPNDYRGQAKYKAGRGLCISEALTVGFIFPDSVHKISLILNS